MPVRRSGRMALVLVAVAVVVGVVTAVVLAGDSGPPETAPTRSPDVPVEPSATVGASFGEPDGVAHCVPSRLTVDRSELVVAAATGRGGDADLQVVPMRDVDDDGGVRSGLAPGTAATSPVEPPATAMDVAWLGRGVVVSQVSRFARGPAGTIAGPCPTTLHTDVVVPGLSTADGASATVSIANPSSTEVSVAVDVLTAAGRAAPETTEFIPIAPRATTILFATDLAPGQRDLAVAVHATGGRVAVSAVQQRVDTTGGVQGRSLVTVPDGAATTWHLPWVGSGGDPAAGLAATDAVPGTGPVPAWLSVANPDDRPAPLSASLLTEQGPVPVELPESVVAPGSVARIDLGPMLAVLAGDVGVEVTSTDDVPIVVAGGGTVSAGAGERTGIQVLAGNPSVARSWVMSGPSDPNRRQLVTVANPTDTAAIVDITAWSGTAAVDTDGFDGVEVVGGTTRTFTLDTPPDGATTITWFVEATSGEVTAGLRSGVVGPGPLDFVAVRATGIDAG